ncbi:hypothetical protein [Virgibacillus ihumii]|uniref:hypothetical protein n=1 Tax=Virgibacillus ihumii TaxID=2686091 RepID=UPI00157D1A2B|nr:hypothetical protein [Virgibacillus ihumii]
MGKNRIRDNSFMDIVNQFASRIEWMLHDVQENDDHGELIQESLFTLWKAYRSYGGAPAGFDRYALLEIRQVLNKVLNGEAGTKRTGFEIYLHSENCGSTQYEADTMNQILSKMTVNQWKWLHGNVLWERAKMKPDMKLPMDFDVKLEGIIEEEDDFPDEQLEE